MAVVSCFHNEIVLGFRFFPNSVQYSGISMFVRKLAIVVHFLHFTLFHQQFLLPPSKKRKKMRILLSQYLSNLVLVPALNQYRFFFFYFIRYWRKEILWFDFTLLFLTRSPWYHSLPLWYFLITFHIYFCTIPMDLENLPDARLHVFSHSFYTFSICWDC